MNNVLKSLLGSLDAAQEGAFASGRGEMDGSGGGGGGGGDVGQILRVMNAHHDTMAYLEASSRRIENDVGAVGRTLSQANQGV